MRSSIQGLHSCHAGPPRLHRQPLLPEESCLGYRVDLPLSFHKGQAHTACIPSLHPAPPSICLLGNPDTGAEKQGRNAHHSGSRRACTSLLTAIQAPGCHKTSMRGHTQRNIQRKHTNCLKGIYLYRLNGQSALGNGATLLVGELVGFLKLMEHGESCSIL